MIQYKYPEEQKILVHYAENQGSGVQILEKEGVEPWMEYIFHSLNGYLVSNGYEDEWDQE